MLYLWDTITNVHINTNESTNTEAINSHWFDLHIDVVSGTCLNVTHHYHIYKEAISY